MQLSDEDIAKFQDLYRSKFGKEITKEDAYEQGIKLVRLMSIVYQPMTEKEFVRIQEHRKKTLPLLTKRIKNV